MSLPENPRTILLLSLVWFVLCHAVECASARKETTEPDTAYAGSAALDSLEAKISRWRLTQWLTDYIFVHPSETDTTRMIEATVVSSESRYLPYRGRVIRDIRILQLPVLSAESGAPRGFLEVGNSIHIDTRKQVIEGYFLMDRGEPLDPRALADTEQILRSTSFILDAAIEVVPAAETPDSVDLLVVTQDVWSIGATGSIRSADNFKVKLFDRNVLGLGQVLETEFDVDHGRSQRFDLSGLYRIENIRGTFVDGELRYVDSHRENRTQVAFSRPFKAVKFRYGGALGLARVEEKDASADVVRSYDAGDVWMGHAFSGGGRRYDSEGRTQLTVSGRLAVKSFVKREPVVEESDRSLHDSNLWLGSVTLSRSDLLRSFMIKSYGVEEDLNSGYLVSFTGGFEDGEFNNRWYSGLRICGGEYESILGYYAWETEAGGFFRGGDFQDGAVLFSATAFTPLSRPGPYRFRHFLGVDYLAGFDRQSNQRLEVNVRGIDTSLGDLERLSLTYESVAFTPWRLFGFRFAVFGALGLGTIGPDPDSFLSSRYYSSLGLGLRFHNDWLVFGAYEVRFSFFPSQPPDASTAEFEFTTVLRYRGGRFTAGPPATVPFD